MTDPKGPFRVYDKELSRKYTTYQTGDHLQVLDEPAINAFGAVLPPEFDVSPQKAAAHKAKDN